MLILRGSWRLSDDTRAVQALRRGDRKVATETLGTGLGGSEGGGYIKDGRSLFRHVPAVRYDEDEVDDRHKDNEVDDGGDEFSERDELTVERPTESRSACAVAREGVNQGRDDVGRKGRNESAEAQRDDESDGDDNEIPAHEKVSETLEHVVSNQMVAMTLASAF